MSAECGRCGHDLGYEGGCAVCRQRERAEAAEVRVAELERELAASRSPEAVEGLRGGEATATERGRQVEQEGWTPEHDDTHTEGALATAAVGYIMGDRAQYPVSWPWKPSSRVRDLTKAGALIAAEIDRLLRLDATSEKEKG